MLKKVRIRILTDRAETAVDLYGNAGMSLAEAREWEHSEMTVEGSYHDNGTRISISYDESAATGLEGSRATISFQKTESAIVSMQRTGSVKTALLFEKGRRHECVYQTPIMPFEVCVQTARVQNAIETMGTMELDYITQIKGAQAEHTRMRIVISPAFDKPQGL